MLTLERPLERPFRVATPADAPALASFITAASEGMAPYVWSQAVGPGGDIQAYGQARMARMAGGGGWVVAEHDGEVVAGLHGYPLPENPDPIPEDFEPMFRPLQELEDAAPSTWYIHVLAARADARGQGWGTKLLDLAETICRDSGLATLSIIVADNNTGAARLYARHGFAEVDRRAMVKGGWQSDGTAWLLMTKPL
ncbi:MAG: GNAT family N-acetyltransferase [Pseudomonadota bacterium]